MNRNSEMEKIYMQQLRDMESAVYFLTAKKRQYERDIYNLRLPFRDPEDPPKPKVKIKEYLSCLGRLAIFFSIITPLTILFLFLMLLFLAPLLLEEFSFSLFFKGVFLVAIIACIITTLRWIKKINQRKADYQLILKENETTRQKNKQVYSVNCSNADRKSTELATINSELQKAQNILADAYDINWIPSRYRNIQVVYYITDMVTTSDINIDEALKYYLLQEANNKLDEILQKLDEIIENQNEIICQQAIAQSKNEALIAQNKTMISQFANIEANTKLSADYSAIGANYSAATAYFSLATYLKN